LGRFLSPDTIIPGAANPQAFNRYSYVLNNPLKYTDPTGHSVACEDGDDCEHDYPAPSGSGGNGNNPNDPTEEADDPNPDSIILPDAPGHDYETENTVCPAVFECTEAEMIAYATMFKYPGQGWWNPVHDLETRYVFPANLLFALTGSVALLLTGAIYVYISDDGLSLTNFSKPTHIFHEGKVTMDYTQSPDGAWTVTRHGTGTNVWPVMGPAIDLANDAIGAPTFDIVDAMMTTYIILDQSGF
jgi:hypothetical protein